MHIMIDIETLGTTPDCVVLSFGAVKFDPYTSVDPYDKVHFKVDVESQTLAGRTICDNTLEWWSKQSVEIQEDAFNSADRLPVEDFLKKISKYCVAADGLWAHGLNFDVGILENLFRQYKTPVPWDFRKLRDTRTLFDLCKTDPRTNIRKNAHNAAEDAYWQAKATQIAFSDLGMSNE